jgi:hypothetical protein
VASASRWRKHANASRNGYLPDKPDRSECGNCPLLARRARISAHSRLGLGGPPNAGILYPVV